MNPDPTSRLRMVAGRHNPQLKLLRKAFAEADLTADACLAIEGVRVIEEAIRSGLKFQAVFFAESAAALHQRLLPQLGAAVDCVIIPDALLKATLPSESPQGVAALVKLRPHTLEDALRAPAPLLLCAAGLQDPGNLGTLIRSAEAFGATGVLLAEATVSPWNAKVVRSAAGSLFRMTVLQTPLADALAALRARGVRLIATSSHRGKPVSEADLRGPVALFIGNEGAGLPTPIVEQMDESVLVPHSAKVESLNAGVAGSILLYEAARQRSGVTSGAAS